VTSPAARRPLGGVGNSDKSGRFGRAAGGVARARQSAPLHSWSRGVLGSLLVLSAFLLTGCATSTIDSRRQERLSAYAALPPEQQQLVDKGQIKVGMSADAVYIAWGPPTEILEQETQQGHTTIWIYHGQWLEESRYWTYREISRDGSTYLERRLESDYFPRSYIRAEIFFVNGAVVRWQTLPRPTY
jgi:hypothetical protein